MKSAAGTGFSRPRLLVKTSEPPRRFTRWPGRSSCPVDLDTAKRRTASPASNPTKRSAPRPSAAPGESRAARWPAARPAARRRRSRRRAASARSAARPPRARHRRDTRRLRARWPPRDRGHRRCPARSARRAAAAARGGCDCAESTRSAFDASSRNAMPRGAQKLAHVRARRLDERPHDDARPRMHAAQAARPGAAQQPQQKRFGLIVLRVRDGDGRRAEARRRAIEERVARGVRRVFDRGARLARERRDVDALDVDRHRPALAARSRQNSASASASAPRS